MNSILSKTFGGLSREYYFRNFIFGLIFPALFYFTFYQGKTEIEIPFGLIAFVLVNTFLYPYARFVYEKIMGFIFGKNVFSVNAILFLISKFITMYLCWVLSIFIAPLGLSYLYFYHTKTKN